MRETTEIRLDERGDETHESWLLVRANRVQGTATHLFDSEIAHHHYVHVVVTRCTRQRQLNHDRLYGSEVLLDFSMSQAQWGAFVSSFGDGTGVPATLTFLAGEGQVPQAPPESRFDESHAEVREAGSRALAEIDASYRQVMDAFENGGGKRVLRAALRDLGIRLQNAPKNMEFAAKSLTEHVENVVTKARADIEGMALAAADAALAESASARQLEAGDSSSSLPGDPDEPF